MFPSNEGKSEICDFLYQTCRILAKNNLVIVINIQKAKSFKEIIENLFHSQSDFQLVKKQEQVYYFTPVLLLPFRRFPTIVKINTVINILIMQLILDIFFRQYQKRFLWFFFPQLADLHQYFGKTWKTIYDVIDFYTSPNLQINQKLDEQKKYLLNTSFLVTTISGTLKSVYLKLHKREIHVVPQGFNQEMFQVSKKSPHIPLLQQDKPIIGFIGHINERLDFALLSKLIKKNTQWRFVFVGPKETNINVAITENHDQINEILNHDNVVWIDEQPKNVIPSLINQFSVCMIPYDIQYEFNRYCYPMKVFEYFYAQKPVISTEIIELKKLQPLLSIARSANDWERELKKLLSSPWSQKNGSLQRKRALENSWEKKLEAISQYLA